MNWSMQCAVQSLFALLLLAAQTGNAGENCQARYDCTAQPPESLHQYAGPLERTLPPTAHSTQMHLHGSYSEGTGSMTAGGAEARNVGVDVLWWSDHDYGIFHQKNITTFSFEDWWEEEWKNEYWVAHSPAGLAKKKYWSFDSANGTDDHEAVISDAQYWDGQHSLLLSAVSQLPDFAEFLYIFDSDSSAIQHARTLAADIEIEIAIFPEQVGTDATAEVLIALSKHGENPARQRWIRYLLDNSAGISPWREGPLYNVPLSYQDNGWNRYTLYLTRDVNEGFPELIGEDNTAHEIRIGVMSRNGATAAAYFDAYHLHFNVWYPELYARQRELLDQLEALNTMPVHLQGAELGVGKHLNMLSESTDVPPHDASLEHAVLQVHGAGGLVMLNHIFGFGEGVVIDPQVTLEELVAENVFGADLLEVGYRLRGGQQLPVFLWIWDQLAKKQLYVVGVGTSDAHSWVPGTNAGRRNNFVSWIYAATPNKPDLLDGLRRGRVYFGDISLFDGKLDLKTKSGFVMGQIVITDKSHETIAVNIDGLVAGDAVYAVVNGERRDRFAVAGSFFSDTIGIDLAGNTCARVEAYSGNRGYNEKVFSNSICFVRQLPDAGITAARAALDVAGFTSELIDNFTITGFTGHVGMKSSSIVVEGHAEDGSLVLNSPVGTSIVDVSFDGLKGLWTQADSRIILWNLYGTGSTSIVTHSE